MSRTDSFKCPGCGAWLEWNATLETMSCPFCSTVIDPVNFDRIPEQEGQTAIDIDQNQTDDEGILHAYHCQMCGSEVTVGDTVAATRCYYCHSPIVLTDQLSSAFKPDAVIPFKLDRADALNAFHAYLNKKKYVDRRFFSSEQMQNLSGVYYPYWCGSISGHASMSGTAQNRSTVRGQHETIITTRRYKIHREGTLVFRKMFRKALKSNDRTLTDGIFDYNLNEAVPYRPQYLSGFMAERRDIDATEVMNDLHAEAARVADSVMRKGLHYDSVQSDTAWTGKSSSLQYLLLPTWLLTYRGNEPGKTYYFMLNGQTGSACGKLPINKAKLITHAVMLGMIVCALFLMGGYFIW